MPYQEFEALLGLLAALVFDARTGTLMLLLVIAAICDYRSHRIPNELVLCGALFAVVYTTVVPPVFGATVLFPLSGLLVGLLLFLPLYLLRAMGAGDVKLLAMVGAFLGPLQTLYAALAIMIVGGALALVWALARGRMLQVLNNLGTLFHFHPLVAAAGATSAGRIAPAASAGKMPYGVAIAIGTIGYLISYQLGLL
jgi:prepilin peptidase CpaA